MGQRSVCGYQNENGDVFFTTVQWAMQPHKILRKALEQETISASSRLDFKFNEWASHIFKTIATFGHISSIDLYKTEEIEQNTKKYNYNYVFLGKDFYPMHLVITNPCEKRDLKQDLEEHPYIYQPGVSYETFLQLISTHPHAQDGVSYFYSELKPDQISFYLGENYAYILDNPIDPMKNELAPIMWANDDAVPKMYQLSSTPTIIETEEAFVLCEDDPDSCMYNPREIYASSNVAHFYTWSRNYYSIDENEYESPEEFIYSMLADSFNSVEEFGQALNKLNETLDENITQFYKWDEASKRLLLLEDSKYAEVFNEHYNPDVYDLAEYVGKSRQGLELLRTKMIVLNVFKFEHGNVLYSVNDFNDPWDSGWCGFAVPAEPNEGGGGFFKDPTPTKETIRYFAQCAQRELNVYNDWSNGENYEFKIYSKDNPSLNNYEVETAIGDNALCEILETHALTYVKDLGSDVTIEELLFPDDMDDMNEELFDNDVNNTVQIKLGQHASVPYRAHTGDAGYDLFVPKDSEEITIKPNSNALINLNICVLPPEDIWFEIRDRSSLAVKGLTVLGGIIDNGYRGEIKVVLANVGDQAYTVKPGDKIAQMIPHKIIDLEFKQVDDFAESSDDNQRGTGGFGSTGR